MLCVAVSSLSSDLARSCSLPSACRHHPILRWYLPSGRRSAMLEGSETPARPRRTDRRRFPQPIARHLRVGHLADRWPLVTGHEAPGGRRLSVGPTVAGTGGGTDGASVVGAARGPPDVVEQPGGMTVTATASRMRRCVALAKITACSWRLGPSPTSECQDAEDAELRGQHGKTDGLGCRPVPHERFGDPLWFLRDAVRRVRSPSRAQDRRSALPAGLP